MPARWWRTASSWTTATSAAARKIRRAILDKNVRVPEDAVIGYDLERDRMHYHVTESGIVVVEGDRTPVEMTALVV